MAERNIIVGHRAESLPPSTYVQQRNALKDAAEADHRAFIERNTREQQAISKINQAISLRHLEISEQGLKIRMLEKSIEQEAQIYKRNMELLERAQEDEFLSALQKLDPTKADSLNAARALMAKYPVTHYSESTKEALGVFNRHLNEAVHQEYVKKQEAAARVEARRLADEAKAEAAKVAKVAKLRDEFDHNKVTLETKLDAIEKFKLDNPTKALDSKLAQEVDYYSGAVQGVAKRLIEADPEQTPDTQDAVAIAKNAPLVVRHADLERKYAASKTKDDRNALNAVKSKLGWGRIDENDKFIEEPAHAAPEGDTKTPKAELSRSSSSAGPPSTATPETYTGGSGGDKETSSSASSPVRPPTKLDNSLLPKIPDTAPKRSFAPPIPSSSDPMDGIARRRDAARSERDKNLEILQNAPKAAFYNPFDSTIYRASEAANKAGKEAIDLTTQYNDDLLARSAASREASRLSRMRADEGLAAVAEQRARFAAAANMAVPTREGDQTLISQEPAVAAPPVSASEPVQPIVAAVKRPPLDDIFK